MKQTKKEEERVVKYVEWIHTLSKEDRNKELLAMLRQDEKYGNRKIIRKVV